MWAQELVENIFNPDPRKMDINKGMAIKLKNIPQSMYKYRKFDKNCIKNLKDGNIWLATADTFNDPYDSAVCFSLQKASADFGRTDHSFRS